MGDFVLDATHARLVAALDQAIEEVQQYGEGYSNRRDVLATASAFVNALRKIAGGNDELNRRAGLIETVCAPWPDYRKAAVEAANYPQSADDVRIAKWFDQRNERRNVRIVVMRLMRRSVPLFRADIDRNVEDIDIVLRDANLDGAARQAFKDWRERCYEAQRASNNLDVDGSWFLLRLHEAAEAELQKNAIDAKAMVDGFEGHWLADVRKAADSLMEWAGERTGNSSEPPPSPPLVIPESNVRANNPKLFPGGTPPNQDITDLAVKLQTERDSGKSMNQIAREFTNGDEAKAKRLLAHIRTLRRRGKINL